MGLESIGITGVFLFAGLVQKLVRCAAAHHACAWTWPFGQTFGHAAVQTTEDAVLLNGHDESATSRQFGEQVGIKRLHGMNLATWAEMPDFLSKSAAASTSGRTVPVDSRATSFPARSSMALPSVNAGGGMHQRFAFLADADVNRVRVL